MEDTTKWFIGIAIVLIVAFSGIWAAQQPVFSIVPLSTYNWSIHSYVEDMQISNDETAINGFRAWSFVYFRMSYKNATDDRKHSLFIPVNNYFDPYITSPRTKDFIANFSRTNINESNIDQRDLIIRDFVNFSKEQGDIGNLSIIRIVHISYIESFLPSINFPSQDKWYCVNGTDMPINYDDVNFYYVSLNPVDMMTDNANDTLFGNWIREANQNYSEIYYPPFDGC
ncbi:MAG: hypothetical protein WCE65_04605 [Methanoregula sp.]